jgi:hypothetical protein
MGYSGNGADSDVGGRTFWVSSVETIHCVRWRGGIALTAVLEPCVRFEDLEFRLLPGWVTCVTHYGRLDILKKGCSETILGVPHVRTSGTIDRLGLKTLRVESETERTTT